MTVKTHSGAVYPVTGWAAGAPGSLPPGKSGADELYRGAVTSGADAPH